jgi:crotonobetainyl-CoA:carnitine CoA-transferase CaiB-like acyl-CoA transferase
MELAQKADVIVENFRPDVKHRLGIDYDSLAKHNAGLVYASISGFGQDGPLADRPGFDQIAQGMGGLMSITGEPGQGPMRVGIPIADLCAGLFAAQAVFIALLERVKSGKGQWVQTSLLQAQAFMLDFQAARYLMDGDVPKQAGNNHPTSIPTGVFKTIDGYINMAVAGELIWQRLAETLEKSEWCDDERFSINEARSKNRDALNAEIEKITRTQTSAHWVSTLNQAGVPAGDINDIGQVFESPQIQHLGLVQPVTSHERGDTQLVGQPISMSRTPSQIAAPPPLAGGDADNILKSIGYSDSDIDKLRASKAI